MTPLLKRWLPEFVVLLITVLGIAFAARRATKKAREAAQHETAASRYKRDNRLQDANAEATKATVALRQAIEATETAERRMKEAAEHESTFADIADSFNKRMLDIRAGSKPVGGSGEDT